MDNQPLVLAATGVRGRPSKWNGFDLCLEILVKTEKIEERRTSERISTDTFQSGWIMYVD